MQPSDLEIVAMLARAVSIAACASVTAALMTYLFRMRRRSGGLAGANALLSLVALALALGYIGRLLADGAGGGALVLLESLTAIIAFAVGVAVWPMVPKLVGQPTHQETRDANVLLAEGQAANRALIAQLSDLNRDLENRVARRTAELEAARHRFEVALSGSDISVLELDTDLVFTWVHNPPEPLTANKMLGRHMTEALPPADAEHFDSIARRVIDHGQGERFEISFDLGGRPRWFEGFVEPRTSDGHVGGVLAAAIDVSRYKEHEREMRDILRELTHRSKNLLAVVQGMARQSSEGNPEAADFLAPFRARLMALSAAHELLVQNGWRGALLDEVMTRAWSDVDGIDGIVLDIDGPAVLLGPDVTQNVMLGAHELVAAAAAAEQRPERVTVVWSLMPDGVFHLDWRMLGSPSIQVSGFGQRLLRTVLPVVLGGEVTTLETSDAGFSYGLRGRIGPQLQRVQNTSRSGRTV